jgi:hypothetical protein
VVSLVYARAFDVTEAETLALRPTCAADYGVMYSSIQETLREVCRIHRELIRNSAASFAKKNHLFSRMGGTSRKRHGEAELNLCEAMAEVIYYHFRDIAGCNKAICELWNSVSSTVDQ